MKRAIKLFVAAWMRKLWLPSVPENLDVLIVSPGGVATSMLMDQVSHYKRINHLHDADGLKHLPRPPSYRPGKKPPHTLFLFGSEEEATASIVRRGWLDFQAAKLGCPLATIAKGDCALRSYKKVLRKQKAAWLANMNKGGDVLCVRYDEIWDRLSEVAKFLEIDDPDFITHFPPKRKRTNMHAPV